MKYQIIKYVDAKNLKEALKKEKEADIDKIECIDDKEANNFNIGYGKGN